MDESEVLLRLLRRYSPSGAEAGAVAEFLRLARNLGFAARRDSVGNGIAARGSGSPTVVFLGHIDTVPGCLPVGRSHGRIRGRGAVDAKGPLAAALVAASTFEGPGRVEVVAAVGEETDSRGAQHLVRRRGVDAVIAGEPSRWDGVTVGYKGDVRFSARFEGRRTHYSSPRPTVGDRALDWVARVRSLPLLAPGPSAFRSASLKVIGLRSGGDDATWAEVELDVRLPPGRSVAEFWSALPRERGQPRLHRTVALEPVEVGRTNPVVRALEAGIRSAGGRPTLWKKSGTSDLNLVAPAWGVGGAAYGPGNPHLDHTATESVSVRELARSVRVLRTAFRQLAAEPPTPRGLAGGGG